MSQSTLPERLVKGFFKLLWRLFLITIYGALKLLGEISLAIAELFKKVLS